MISRCFQNHSSYKFLFFDELKDLYPFEEKSEEQFEIPPTSAHSLFPLPLSLFHPPDIAFSPTATTTNITLTTGAMKNSFLPHLQKRNSDVYVF